jgi:hypothetical protein
MLLLMTSEQLEVHLCGHRCWLDSPCWASAALMPPNVAGFLRYLVGHTAKTACEADVNQQPGKMALA